MRDHREAGRRVQDVRTCLTHRFEGQRARDELGEEHARLCYGLTHWFIGVTPAFARSAQNAMDPGTVWVV